MLTGAVPPQRRQSLVAGFQAGKRQALMATYGTGGLGFTLHRARHVVRTERISSVFTPARARARLELQQGIRQWLERC